MLNINQNCRRKKKKKTPPETKNHRHKRTKSRCCYFMNSKRKIFFFNVGSVLRQVLYMICGYWLCLRVSVSQVPYFLQVTLQHALLDQAVQVEIPLQ